jgi:crotonobetainyl-CoA:carnitine CoA-transferase CaiB-like acyl-CoA transferase
MFPQGTFAAADGPITLASGSDAMWRRLCQVLELSELADDPRFIDNAVRMANRVELRRILEARLGTRTAAEWLEAINDAGVPASPIYSVDQTLNSEIVHALGMVASVEHPTIGDLSVLGRPFTLGDERTGWLHRAPPLLGEHSVEVCEELGASADDVKALVESGVIVDGRASVTA